MKTVSTYDLIFGKFDNKTAITTYAADCKTVTGWFVKVDGIFKFLPL